MTTDQKLVAAEAALIVARNSIKRGDVRAAAIDAMRAADLLYGLAHGEQGSETATPEPATATHAA